MPTPDTSFLAPYVVADDAGLPLKQRLRLVADRIHEDLQSTEPAAAEEPPANDVWLKYVGACALLGQLSSHRNLYDHKDLIERAMNDCAELSDGRLEVVEAGEGWSLEPVQR